MHRLIGFGAYFHKVFVKLFSITSEVPDAAFPGFKTFGDAGIECFGIHPEHLIGAGNIFTAAPVRLNSASGTFLKAGLHELISIDHGSNPGYNNTNQYKTQEHHCSSDEHSHCRPFSSVFNSAGDTLHINYTLI